MREASSRTLISDLVGAGARVRAYDPAAGHEAERLYRDSPGIEIVDSALAALEGADALAVMTEWQEFRSPDFATIRARLKTPAIFDGRNLYDPQVLKSSGFEYYPIGRKA
jgi:UDPglucose 6-dehydrogenase